MVGTGVLTESDLASAINWQALGVLLGMFIIASSLREAGFFEWMGLHLARSVDAHPIRMYVLLPLMTAGMASLLDIVTVALFIVPLTVEVFEGLEIDPVPFVIAEVLAANIGGIATMVGDPTNIIIGSSLGLTFNQFLQNTAPIALAAIAVNGGLLYLKNWSSLNARERNDPSLRRKPCAFRDSRSMGHRIDFTSCRQRATGHGLHSCYRGYGQYAWRGHRPTSLGACCRNWNRRNGNARRYGFQPCRTEHS